MHGTSLKHRNRKAIVSPKAVALAGMTVLFLSDVARELKQKTFYTLKCRQQPNKLIDNRKLSARLAVNGNKKKI